MTKPVKGWAPRDPEGQLYACVGTRSDAMDRAAFAFTGWGTIKLPRDWRRAYRAGWRVVPVIMKERKA